MIRLAILHLPFWAYRMYFLIVCVLLLSACDFSERGERSVTAPIPRYKVKYITQKPIIDGKIDDIVWRDATPLTLRFPWDSQTGAKQRTTVRLLWDDNNLYVAYDCEDRNITARHEYRDDPVWEDDTVEIFINPRPTLDTYFGIEINARGTLFDYVYIFPHMLLRKFDLQGVNLATHLDGSLYDRTDRDSGWQLEVAIPLKNFTDIKGVGPIANGTIWTMNLNRWDGTEPNRRLSMWSDSGMNQPIPHNPKRFGQLQFAK